MKKTHRQLIIWPILLLATLFLAGCAKDEQTSKSQIKIVTSTNIYADIAQNIVGKYGKATALIANGNSNPHDYEPTTNAAKTVADADIIVANGMGYDSWMGNLAASNGKKAVKVGEDLMQLDSSANPHIWYNLNMPKKYVAYLVKKLSKLDKKHASYYQAQGKKYLQKIAKIEKVADGIKGGKAKPVFVSEPVFDYALERTGFKIGNKNFEEATEKETDPSAAVIAQMNEAIKKKQIPFFVNNTQASSDTVKYFVKKAKKQGIPIVEVRETMPNKVSYADWMLDNYQKLAKFGD
ncbi:metal ABC transporter solute-binding protein, Zn/Mn family [Lactobacillus delbrueckii]|uniref:metal ABC transporter solute-binding protein, Zn/Mn family n=1 Tax=Lactobacillus delbrueckii TaxID=1584 RepID=UPI001C1E1C8E|nr:zinc ABC transporter substrate-binding protein [Lactobacillus delbrueckii]MBU6048698.1 zinc ABC transporter substrate-binding protein [Lactobacillus delbrueckii]UUY36253.1 zinc ABC transporter substrate-binding protein [Lactobacillus delbrueckii subsp. bulgaricus]